MLCSIEHSIASLVKCKTRQAFKEVILNVLVNV